MYLRIPSGIHTVDNIVIYGVYPEGLRRDYGEGREGMPCPHGGKCEG